MVGPNDDDRMARPPGGDPAQKMTMGMVHVENIELFLPKIAGEVQNITQMSGQKRGMIDLYRMVQSKLIRCLHSRLEDSLFNAVLQGNRRFPIGEGDVMSPLLQPLAEVQRWIGRTGPLPVAEKMKDFHSGALLPYSRSLSTGLFRIRKRMGRDSQVPKL